jgi:hypothetical protein
MLGIYILQWPPAAWVDVESLFYGSGYLVRSIFVIKRYCIVHKTVLYVKRYFIRHKTALYYTYNGTVLD